VRSVAAWLQIKPAGRPELLWRDRASSLGQSMRAAGPQLKLLFFGADELETWCVCVSHYVWVTEALGGSTRR
jgi:hypothetical protein